MTKRGGIGSQVGEVLLERDEWITEIQGTHLPEVLSSLKFVSNKGSRLIALTKDPFGAILIFVPRNVGTVWKHRKHRIRFESYQQSSFTCCFSHGVTLFPRTLVSKTNHFLDSQKNSLSALFSGESYVYQIQATFAEYPGPGTSPKMLKFEARPEADHSGVILSTFAKYVSTLPSFCAPKLTETWS